MKHADGKALDEIEPLLDQLRRIEDLTEKKRGVFYLSSKAFLHFHVDGAVVYADARLSGPDFDRSRIASESEQRRLLGSIQRYLKTRRDAK